jgi:hypothetical protein|tara:strand:+ start:5456 stop:5851 length:396 start_codon:yes stop_codon:yes gene_type:complete
MNQETEALARLMASIIKKNDLNEQQAGGLWDDLGDEIGGHMEDPDFEADETLLQAFKYSYDGFIPVTYISKDDIRASFQDVGELTPERKKLIDNMTDDDMRYLAGKMADAYVGQIYWESIRIIINHDFYEF